MNKYSNQGIIFTNKNINFTAYIFFINQNDTLYKSCSSNTYSKLFQAIPSYSKLFQAFSFISIHRNKTLFLFQNTENLAEPPSLESFSSYES